MVLLSVLDVVLVVLGGAGMLYQAVCIVISLFAKPIKFPEAPMNKRYAVLISARNEANVIGNLIDCLHSQTYPSELIDIWLVADNCTDNTAEVARNMGCHVIERFNKEQVGKGYALTYLLDQMNESGASDPYDAFFVFDADNKLDKHYIEEMNKGFQAGFKILTSYRNSVNLSDNWVSSGSALWFIRESRFVSASRMWLGNSCHVGGTGFMFSQEIMRRNNGWKFHLLTEDLEFTMDSVLHGDRIGYCGTAILYDEQPVTFAQSWRQRLRWSKGFLQVFRYYGPALIKRAVRERDFSAVDFTLLLCPFTVLGIARVRWHAVRRLRFRDMAKPAEFADRLDIRHCDIGDRHDGTRRIDHRGGTRSRGRHQQGAARLRAGLPDLHAELCADFVPGGVRQVRMEADRA